MGPGFIVLIIVLGASVVAFTVLVLRSLTMPKRVSTIDTLLKQNKVSQAVRLAKKMADTSPRDAAVRHRLGLAYLQDGKSELALMEYRVVNEIGDFSQIPEESFREQIADLYERFSQPEEALKEYLLLIKQSPENPSFLYRAGLLFESRNKTGQAAKYFKLTLDRDPKHANAHAHLGGLLYRAQKANVAREHLEQAVRFDSDNHLAHYQLGRIQKDGKDYNGALRSFERASKSPELKVKCLVERGGCFMSMNDYERAAPELERAIKLSKNPTAPEVLFARYFLGLAYERTRRIEDAVVQFEAIYSVNPGFKDVAERLSGYQDVRTDDRLKDYLTAGTQEFEKLCAAVVQQMKLLITKSERGPDGDSVYVVAEEDQSKWRNARKMPKMIRFFRSADAIDESTIRDLHEAMKRDNITRGIIVTSSGFARSAQQYAESRPIDLAGPKQLKKLLDAVPSQ